LLRNFELPKAMQIATKRHNQRVLCIAPLDEVLFRKTSAKHWQNAGNVLNHHQASL
jgi:hypothetical protein